MTQAEHARRIKTCLDKLDKWHRRLHQSLADLACEHGEAACLDEDIMIAAAAPKKEPPNP